MTFKGWAIGIGALAAVIACSKAEPKDPRGCAVEGSPNTCGEGFVCSTDFDVTGSCIPVVCSGLSTCCPYLKKAEHDTCFENTKKLALAGDATQCATTLKGYIDAGFCTKDPNADRICNREVCAEFLKGHSDFEAFECCTGQICVLPAGTHEQEGTCGSCVANGAPCSADTHCCENLRCDTVATNRCVPLREKGKACSSAFDCLDNLDCVDQVCAEPKTPPPSSSSSSGSSGTTACDPKSCSGSQGDCSGGFCFFCSYSCDGNTCKQTCTD